MAWKKAQYNCWTTEGIKVVDGFSNGVFGVDPRPNLRSESRGAWAIIHLRTGYAATFVGGSKAMAQRIADELSEVANWDFDHPEGARERSQKVKPIAERYARSILPSHAVGRLREAFRYPEETTPDKTTNGGTSQ